ncbi:MAG TPA: beta-galactosidase [Verrucomicrobiae bacterium]|jgi:hypothetical protein|nr:beta-galactosidase [Verrucomicrobiae bacterium]
MKKTALFLALILAFPAVPARAQETLKIGTTYSIHQSEYLDMDWKETYLALLEFHFDVIRLGTYWNRIEKDEGVLDFEYLDWQIAEAKKRHIPVLLTLGMKAPRWPEYYIPDWVLKHIKLKFGQDVSESAYLREKALHFVSVVVERYKDEDIVQYWQVENEGLDRAGRNYWWIGKAFIQEEIALVRQLDPKKRPIIVSSATYPNRFLNFLARFFAKNDPISDALEISDILGINVYPAVGHKMAWKKIYFWTTPTERNSYFSELLARAKAVGKKVWIMELQAEPWEPGELVHVGKERPPTGWPESVRESFAEFQKIGFHTILLWGGEYWLYRLVQHQDENWWDMVMDFFKSKEDKEKEEKAEAEKKENTLAAVKKDVAEHVAEKKATEDRAEAKSPAS